MRHALTLVTGADGFPVDPMDGVRLYEARHRELARDIAVRAYLLGLTVWTGTTNWVPEPVMEDGFDRHSMRLRVCP